MIKIRYPTSATAIGSAREEFRSYKSSGVAEGSTSGFHYHTVQHFIDLLPDQSTRPGKPKTHNSSSSYLLPPAACLRQPSFT
jgi:hypothetical protein